MLYKSTWYPVIVPGQENLSHYLTTGKQILQVWRKGTFILRMSTQVVPLLLRVNKLHLSVLNRPVVLDQLFPVTNPTLSEAMAAETPIAT